VYCRPYAPEGKGKLERWHRTLRDQFLSEIDLTRVNDLEDLNARLWAWIEQFYHRTAHGGLQDKTPLQRFQQDLPKIRTLGQKAAELDEIFYHRVKRKVRKDGSVAYQGQDFEVAYELSGKNVQLVVDPHAKQVVFVEDDTGKRLGMATPLDQQANNHRRRHRPEAVNPATASTDMKLDRPKQGANLVELALQQYYPANLKEDS
jgi:hypothetical protein